MPQKSQSPSKTYGCTTHQCASKLQAVCFTCQKLFCFKCSLQHAQKYTNPAHNMVQIEDSIPEISKISKKLAKHAGQLLKSSESRQKKLKEDSSIKLSPQKFQEQLDEVNFMKKQTLKVVEKFFSQISLQLVNIWEHYLKKYSSFDLSEKIYQIKKKLQVYAEPWNINETKEQILRGFFKEKLEEQVEFYTKKILGENESELEIPRCPEIRIDDRVLVQLSQVLCGSISTKNYTFELGESKRRQKEERKLRISLDNYLHKSVTWLPIFPIKKNHCFLYNIQNKNYEIQEFQQLQYLPDYPKTIIIPNGDIHIIGGTKNDHVIDTHLVFRSSSSEVFKLGSLPCPRNPSNSLVYFNKSIYLIGGINQKHQWDSKCYRYLLETKEWKEIPPMHVPKPHQSCSLFNSSIYCFGIPQQKKINIEKYSIERAVWEEMSINNFLSNPFNFAAGFVSCQINQRQILMFGGKKFLESATTNKRTTDRTLQEHVYVFQPQTNSFEVKGPLFPCLGVQYGQFYPVISDNKVYVCEYILCKTNPISRWYDNIQVLEITENGEIESVIILEEN